MTQSNITVLPMEQKHLQAVAQLEEANFSLPWDYASLESELKNPLALWLVALDGDAVVGYIGSQAVLEEADMMNLAVSEAYRRRGIARELVRELISRLSMNGVTCLTLEVRASNNAAVSLYGSMGFVQVGRRPKYYQKPREDALILRKEWEV